MDVEMISSAAREDQHDDKDDSGIEQDNSWLYIRIAVEDHNLQKVLKLNLDDTVWNAKQKVLQVLLRVKIRCTMRRHRTDFPLQELVDGLNFGLYLPPCNGRAGKFLDESRYLREYPLSGPVAYLEVSSKRTIESRSLLSSLVVVEVQETRLQSDSSGSEVNQYESK